ncbi:hypothetical protein [Eggerthella sp. HGA1]|uniref:hypothetical protein n=1 Tax=Eggerthella sp. HGA1 TaxID=910311 RepID=UPI001111F4DB|nr:hypothetical protein [Eggerthella sp. HGA1]
MDGVYALDHVLGCSHGCKYPCNAYLAAKKLGQVGSYEDWCEPKLVENAIELLERELTSARREPVRRVHVCFAADPFMYGQELVQAATSGVLNLVNRKCDIPVTLLTKGAYPRVHRRPLRYANGDVVDAVWFERPHGGSLEGPLHPGNEYGISLSSLDEGFRERWEPGAAPCAERIASLKALHDAGCRTWVSMEPWPSPTILAAATGTRDDAAHEASYGTSIAEVLWMMRGFKALDELLEEVSFVDKITFGRWDYGSSSEWEDYYNSCTDNVRTFCAVRNIECVIEEEADILGSLEVDGEGASMDGGILRWNPIYVDELGVIDDEETDADPKPWDSRR